MSVIFRGESQMEITSVISQEALAVDAGVSGDDSFDIMAR